MDYVKCMTITQNVDPKVYSYLTDDNIRYPKDFKRWHDIRIEEKRVIEEEQEWLRKEKAKKEKEKLVSDFLIAAEKYLPLAGFNKDKHYAIFIAQSPAELVKEGNAQGKIGVGK